MASISLLKIAEKMKLENLTPEINLKGIKVTLPDINRPALPMAGYFEHFEATRLQVIGFVEYSYVKRMSEKEEKEMLEKINELGIGPQGFGGKTTAIGLNIETLPTHIAGMPCAININCHVTRHKTEVI